MKKSLVALAVLAASGASFAQVTVSGALGFSFQKNATTPGTAATKGMQMTDGKINFEAKEDLGGGMSLTAAQSFNLKGRDTGLSARDASLTLATKAATLQLGAIERCTRIDNVAGAPVSLATGHDAGTAGAPLDYSTFTLDGSCHNVDTAAVSLPLGAVTLGASYNEVSGVAPGAAAGTANSTGGNVGGVNYYLLSADYAAGALAIGIDYRTVKADNAANTAFSPAAFNDGLATTSLSASYDFGFAKIGAGIKTANHNAPTQTTFSVAAPLSSAATVGLIYSNRASVSTDAAYFNTAVNSVSATAIGIDYKLSKLTVLNASYGMYSGLNNSPIDNEYRIRLLKSF
ncbi:porin [Rhodoferax aquaticus]|uniref:Porin n=1 Tax=Rhodoferax aquaticus TaxID=2527691 RepID=A0A515ESV5_9BURK|nr:porin [Rhodoferax aquaticus]QDL55745.1 porin [Rhodoferax aquaticus]